MEGEGGKGLIGRPLSVLGFSHEVAGSGGWHFWERGVACSNLIPQDLFLPPCCCGGDVGGLWGCWCCVIPFSDRCETLEAFNDLSKLVSLKVHYGF